jgi:hypothetical protein
MQGPDHPRGSCGRLPARVAERELRRPARRLFSGPTALRSARNTLLNGPATLLSAGDTLFNRRNG